MPLVARDGDLTACGAHLISGAKKTFVNGKLIVRLGDTGSHGGEVITSSKKSQAEGSLIARVGDIYNCAIHGPNPIVEGSPNTIDEG